MKIKKFNKNIHIIYKLDKNEATCRSCLKDIESNGGIGIRISNKEKNHDTATFCLDCFRRRGIMEIECDPSPIIDMTKCICCNKLFLSYEDNLLYLYELELCIHEDCVQTLIEQIDEVIRENEQEFVAYRL